MRLYTLVMVAIFSSLITFPGNAEARPRTIHAEWSMQAVPGIAGFRFYHKNSLACEIADPNATALDCEVDVTEGETWFTLTYYLTDGTESAHSAPMMHTFSSELAANFSANTLSGPAPLEVTFDASSSTGDIATYAWTFSDGATASGSSVAHSFSSQGSFLVTLTVTGTSGAADQKTLTVVATETTAENTPPQAVISTSTSAGTAPFQVVFDAGGSSDSDGNIVSYHWDMGDGSSVSGDRVNHTYTTAGSYNPTLTVTDDGGLADSTSTPVLVEPPAQDNSLPQAVISASASQGEAPLQITFDAGNSSDSDGSIVSYNWDFGDGTNGSGKNISHSFDQPAEYTVSLTVVDDLNVASQPATLVVKVLEQGSQQAPGKTDIVPILNLLLLDD